MGLESFYLFRLDEEYVVRAWFVTGLAQYCFFLFEKILHGWLSCVVWKRSQVDGTMKGSSARFINHRFKFFVIWWTASTMITENYSQLQREHGSEDHQSRRQQQRHAQVHNILLHQGYWNWCVVWSTCSVLCERRLGRSLITIYLGEEITVDYKLKPEPEEQRIPCLCNAENCRLFLNWIICSRLPRPWIITTPFAIWGWWHEPQRGIASLNPVPAFRDAHVWIRKRVRSFFWNSGVRICSSIAMLACCPTVYHPISLKTQWRKHHKSSAFSLNFSCSWLKHPDFLLRYVWIKFTFQNSTTTCTKDATRAVNAQLINTPATHAGGCWRGAVEQLQLLLNVALIVSIKAPVLRFSPWFCMPHTVTFDSSYESCVLMNHPIFLRPVLLLDHRPGNRPSRRKSKNPKP